MQVYHAKWTPSLQVAVYLWAFPHRGRLQVNGNTPIYHRFFSLVVLSLLPGNAKPLAVERELVLE